MTKLKRSILPIHKISGKKKRLILLACIILALGVSIFWIWQTQAMGTSNTHYIESEFAQFQDPSLRGATTSTTTGLNGEANVVAVAKWLAIFAGAGFLVGFGFFFHRASSR